MIVSFRALLWVKWRTTKHKLSDLKRIRFARTISFLIYAVITIMVASFGVAGLAAGLGVAEVALEQSKEGAINGTVLMLGLDFILIYFLMVWLGDLIAEIKRAEPIDFRKMLYLPISLRTVFLLNFGLALISPMFVGFIVPLMTFTLATTWVLGPHMLLCLPIGFMYYIMLAFWTYYVQGILAYIMENKRTRQKVLVLVPMLFIVPYFL